MAVAPHSFVHRGHWIAEGFLFDPGLIGEAQCRTRILELWQDGASLRRLGNWYLLLLPRALPCHAGQSPGLPLVRQGDRLCSAELRAQEVQHVPPHIDLLCVHGAAIVEAQINQLPVEDPAPWLDLRGWSLVATQPLGDLPPPPAPPPKKPSAQLRDHIAGMPPAPAQAKLLQDALRGRTPEQASQGAIPRLLQGVFGFLRGVREGLSAAHGSPTIGSSAIGSEAASAPSGPSPWARLSKWVSRLWNRALLASRISSLFGRRQARYLAELMRMFDDGDLEQALRHAVPLGGEGEGTPSAGMSLPKARDALRMSMLPATGGGPSLLVHSQVMDMLRQRYRRAFERLVQQGRIEEAAFVLADLLHDTDEAVSFLESHGELQLAAELAEARDLPAPRRVRQWLLAGETERAVRVARRHEAFSTAIGLLEPQHPEPAKLLRIKWAEGLCERADFESAVCAIWPIESARHLTRPWIEAGMNMGGPRAARLLVRAVALMPERFSAWLAHAESLWQQQDPDSPRTRTALADALLSEPEGPETRLLAKGTARALFVDAATGGAVAPKMLRALVRYTQDGALKTDWPGPPGPSPVDRAPPLKVMVGVHDVGSVAIFDAVLLSKGRLLLALGEAGARLISSKGRTIAHFKAPAHRLVRSDHGHRALALARRGRWTKVTQVDLVHLRATPWMDLEIGPYCETFDGWTWFVSLQGVLTGIDLATTPARQTYRNTDCHPLSIARNAERLCVHHEQENEEQLWQLDLPSLTLRARTPLAFGEGSLTIGPCNAAGQVPYELVPQPESPEIPGRRGVLGTPPHREHSCAIQEARTTALQQAGEHTIRCFTHPPGDGVQVLRTSGGEREAELLLQGAGAVHARSQGTSLIVCDDRGRLLIVDLTRRTMQTSLRIHA